MIYVVQKQSIIRYLSHFIPRTCRIEVLNAESQYILDYVKYEDTEDRFDSEECKFRFGKHLGRGNYKIAFDHSDENTFEFFLEYVVLDNHPPVECRMNEFNALFYEYMQIEPLQENSENFEVLLYEFIEKARVSQYQHNADRVVVMRWSTMGEYWKREGTIAKRDFDSIILDRNTETTLFQDLDDFVSPETRDFYLKHSIPFRRAYLLHGKPGTGKSSIIHGIASKLDRPIHKVNLVAPKLCDDGLQQAIREVSKDGIIVFEDIDALFGVHREKTEATNVTFSGLLNALDGFATNTNGVLIIFTTNHPEKLDSAIRRKGRIDLEFEIKPCNQDQAERMFLRFYPNSMDEARIFGKLANGSTPAQVQHHFILNRKSNAEKASKFSSESNMTPSFHAYS